MKSIVWFKKDLRSIDHEPLFLASQSEECIGLYIVEPRWLISYEFDESHWQFLKESLVDLSKQLQKWNIPLIIKTGEVVLVFRELRCKFKLTANSLIHKSLFYPYGVRTKS